MAPPLAAKVTESVAGPVVHLVGAAASLLEGDELRIDLHVGDGSRLTVRSTAAQLAHPCPNGGRTGFAVFAAVGSGGALAWLVEPTIVAAGGDHHATARVELATAARVLWVEELVLGRTAVEAAGAQVRTRLDIEQAGWPVWRDGLDTERPGARGPAVLDGARAISTVVGAGAGDARLSRWLGAELADRHPAREAVVQEWLAMVLACAPS